MFFKAMFFIPFSSLKYMTTKSKSKQEKFYVTTAIDYVNSEPHIGHAYQKIAADVLSRWHKLIGNDVLFVTGTDEHGKKVSDSASKAKMQPKQFVDEISQKFKDAWATLNINYDRFIRTTDEDHKKIVQNIIKKCDKAGDIYKGTYEGFYCTNCEAYYTEKDLIDECCPIHKKKAEKMKEESYFFKLSKYQKFLLDLYKKSPEFTLPKERRNEIINKVKEELRDFSITRTNFNWGIPFPLDQKHVIYVWFDALINYYSATQSNNWQKFWPANIHLLGKDNSWFHCVYWPAMLKSAGIELPKTVFVHGFLTFNGEKISKSLGNSISPTSLVNKYGADSIRYYCLRQVPFGEDGDFSEQALIERHNNELANKLGNLVSRVSALAEKYSLEKSKIKVLDSKNTTKSVEKHMQNYEFDKALSEIFALIDKCNVYVQENKLWETKDKKALYELSNAIKDIAILLSPFIPESSEKISKTFNFGISLNALKEPLKISKISKAPILFNKIESNKESNEDKPLTDNKSNKENQKVNKTQKIEGIMTSIEFSEWAKLDLRVGEIESAEEIEGADKLYKLSIDLGTEKRTLVAGLKKYYSPEQLKNKRCIVFTNLAPRKMKGVESQGMILAAVSKDESQVVLISPEKDIAVGSKIR